MSDVPLIRQRDIGARLAERQPAAAAISPPGKPAILGIAASTGGPQALVKVLGGLPADFPLPILLVQHIGAAFVEGFAHWLDGVVPMKVVLGAEGDMPRPGVVHVAPGDHHMILGQGRAIRLSQHPPVDGQRPAATEMFRSIADAYGAAGLGVLLTGMGEDGARGLVAMRRQGAMTITEDASTAVVYGMPAAAVRLGGSGIALPLPLIAPRLLRLVQGGVGAGQAMT
jgi:two-component system chemotaxis response regulator CheB